MVYKNNTNDSGSLMDMYVSFFILKRENVHYNSKTHLVGPTSFFKLLWFQFFYFFIIIFHHLIPTKIMSSSCAFILREKIDKIK